MAVHKCVFLAVFLAVGAFLALYLIGFAAPYWFVEGVTISGLWQKCELDLCQRIPDPSSTQKAAQAMCSIGVIVGLLGGIAFILWLLAVLQNISTDKGAYSIAPRAAGILIIIAGIFGVIGVMISGIKYKERTNRTPEGFAFWLAVCGAAGFIVTGPISFVVSRF